MRNIRYDLLDDLKEELKKELKWQYYNELKKLINEAKDLQLKEHQEKEKKQQIEMMSRYTLLRREYLQRGTKGFYKNSFEEVELFNATDKQIEKKLKTLNKYKRTRFFTIVKDIKTTSRKGKAEYLKYLIDKQYNLIK